MPNITPKHQQFETGCVLVPNDERDYDAGLLMPQGSADGVGIVLPQEFDVETKGILNQRQIDACVGFGGAVSHSNNENVLLSPRFSWSAAKWFDGYGGWGTSIYSLLRGMTIIGAMPYGVIDEDTSMDRDRYMRAFSNGEVNDMMKTMAKAFAADSFWRVKAWDKYRDTTALAEALVHFNRTLITTLPWYPNMNKTDRNGYLPLPDKSLQPQGHLVILRSMRFDKSGELEFRFQNSWDKTWGQNGCFWVEAKNLIEFRFGGFHVILDVPADKARVLNKYEGQVVRNHPEDGDTKPKHYYVGKGKIAHIENEKKFYFGRDNADWWGDWGDTIMIPENLDGMEDIVF